MYEQEITAIISALVICIIVWLCHGLLIINADNAITHKVYARIENARELKLANAAITGHAERQRDVAAFRCSGREGAVDAKAKMMLCVMMLPLVVVGCTSKQSVSQ